MLKSKRPLIVVLSLLGLSMANIAQPTLEAFASSMARQPAAADESFLHEFDSVNKLLAKVGLQIKILIDWARGKPHALFAELRKHRPVLYAPPIPIKENADTKNTFPNKKYPNTGTVVLSMYDDVVDVFKHPMIFTVRGYQSKFEPGMGSFMLDHDGSKYNSVEKPWMRKLIPHNPAELKLVYQLVEKLTNQAIEEGKYVGTSVDGKVFGRIEVVNQVARRVPVLLTGAYFGFPGPNEESMFRWSHDSQEDYFHNPTNDPGIHAAGIRAGKEMRIYAQQLITERKKVLAANPALAKAPDADILTRMLSDKEAARDLNDDRIAVLIIGSLIGGVETSQAAITQALEELLKRPEQLAAAREAAKRNDIKLVGKYVWEALRFQPVFPFVMRYAEQDYRLASGRGLIKKGTLVLASSMSAMFDETHIKNPMEFRIDRPETGPDKAYFHLGYDENSHRCLGDYVSLVQVPTIMKALLLKPNLRVASGFRGQLDKMGPVHREKDRPFPEHMEIEWDEESVPAGKPQIADKKFAFEAYLMDFDRTDFFQCMTGKEYGMFLPAVNIYVDSHSNEHRGLFWCRLNKEFRSCMVKKAFSPTKGFNLVENSKDPKVYAKHKAALIDCEQSTKKLTRAERAFYFDIMLEQPYLSLDRIPTDQAKRPAGKGYEYEDYIKYYSRFHFWACFRNPAGLISFNEEQWLFYARLPWQFRICMGKPILTNKVTGGQFGHTRAEQFELCKGGFDGEEVTKLGASHKEGKLSAEERYFFKKVMLGEKDVNFEAIKAEVENERLEEVKHQLGELSLL